VDTALLSLISLFNNNNGTYKSIIKISCLKSSCNTLYLEVNKNTLVTVGIIILVSGGISSTLHKLSNSLCQVYEMLPVLGRLPSDSFAGIVNDDDNASAVAEEGSSSSSVEGEIPPSTLGSSGVYRIDKFNKQT
jgi:hypothetical protein